MSHFLTMVFVKENGKGVDDLMERFDEGLEVEPYIMYTRENAIKAMRQDIQDYEKNWYKPYLANQEEYEKKCANNPEHLDYIKNKFKERLTWTDEQCYQYMLSRYPEDRIDEDGNILGVINPDAKYDYYVHTTVLTNKSAEKTDCDFVSEINFDKTMTPYAFVTAEGEWHERGIVGWFGCSYDEKDEEVWEKEFADYVKSLKEDKNIIVASLEEERN